MKRLIEDALIVEFRDKLIEEGKSDSTISQYMKGVKSFRDYLAGQVLTDEILQGYVLWLQEKGLHKSGINAYITAVNTFFRIIGWKEFYLAPLHTAETGKERKNVVSDQEFNKMISTARAIGNEKMALVIEVFGKTDIWLKELGKLMADDVINGMLYTTRKNKRHCCVIPYDVRKHLLMYMKKNKIRTGRVICTSSGNEMEKSNIIKRIKYIARCAGIDDEKVSVRNLRRKTVEDEERESLLMVYKFFLQKEVLDQQEIPEVEDIEYCQKKIEGLKREIQLYEERIERLKMKQQRAICSDEQLQIIKNLIALGVPEDVILQMYGTKQYEMARKLL